MKYLLVPFLVLAFYSPPALSIEKAQVHGKWICGPYYMTGELSNIMSTDTYEFSVNGSYLETTDTIYTSKKNGSSINLVTTLIGSWKIVDKILVLIAKEVDVIFTSNSLYTEEIAQMKAEEALEIKDTFKFAFIEISDTKMKLGVIEALHESFDDFIFNCNKA